MLPVLSFCNFKACDILPCIIFCTGRIASLATLYCLWVRDTRFEVELRDPRSLRARRDGTRDASGPQKLVCPMPGKIVRLLVTEKSEVEAGQGIVVVEAMKMQNEIKSPKKGVVQKILVAQGASVNAGDVLAIVE